MLDTYWSDDGSLPRPGTRLRWLFSAVWLVYLIDPLYGQFTENHSVLQQAGAVLIVVAFCAAYAPLVASAGDQTRRTRAGLGAVVAIATIAVLVHGTDWIALWIYVSAATGYVLAGNPARREVVMAALTGVMALYSLLALLSHTGWADYFIVLIPVAFLGWAMAGFRQQVRLMRQLGEARDTVAKLAASEERLRLARDMHDLTGQSLSTITLKADLAARRLRRLPQDEQTEAITAELTDIATVSRQTLHDIREAVSGYRRPTLAIEVITARNALEAAGIALDEDPALITQSGTGDPVAEAALAWCLREAVTNVVRHSRAVTCRIRLTVQHDELRLEVADDGQGIGAPARTPPGHGLRNMSERLAAVGGCLTLRPAVPGLRLIATVRADGTGSCP